MRVVMWPRMRAKPYLGLRVDTPQGSWHLGRIREGRLRGPWSRWRNRRLTLRYMRERTRLLSGSEAAEWARVTREWKEQNR